MKNILKVDISTYIIFLLYLISGNFKEIIILYLIIFIHEMGHFIFIKLYNKKIIEIKFYPFGGITKYNSLVNHKIREELLISLGGILNQILLFIIFFILFKYNLINYFSYHTFIKLNKSLLIFNALPIIGLDGEKIIHIILELLLPYKKVNNIMIIVSIITLIIFIVKSVVLKINIIFVITFLIYKLIYFIRNKKYLENKFYLEKYLYNIPYRRIKYISDNKIENMYQETYHFFNYINEKKFLKIIYGKE